MYLFSNFRIPCLRQYFVHQNCGVVRLQHKESHIHETFHQTIRLYKLKALGLSTKQSNAYDGCFFFCDFYVHHTNFDIKLSYKQWLPS